MGTQTGSQAHDRNFYQRTSPAIRLEPERAFISSHRQVHKMPSFADSTEQPLPSKGRVLLYCQWYLPLLGTLMGQPIVVSLYPTLGAAWGSHGPQLANPWEMDGRTGKHVLFRELAHVAMETEKFHDVQLASQTWKSLSPQPRPKAKG